jgi:L-alanine-DL-glutamate epimerase-like enolase superfamily enzyme
MFDLPKLSEGLQVATRPNQRPKLKITDIKTAYLQGFHVRIYTDQGLTGDGEAVDAISGSAGIVQGFRFALMGHDPLNDLPTAKRFAKEVEPFKLVWLEEPVPPENIDAMRDVRQSNPHAHLLRRKHIYEVGLPRAVREERSRHNHAGYPEVRRLDGTVARVADSGAALITGMC